VRVAVVGSGPSGVAAASVLAEQGHAVEVLDVGHQPGAAAQSLAGEVRAAIGRGERPGRALYHALHHGPGGAARSPLAGLGTLLGRVEATRSQKRILGSTFVGQRGQGDPRRERGGDALAPEGRTLERVGRRVLPVAAGRLRGLADRGGGVAPHTTRAALLGLGQSKDALGAPTR
jgi:glycine/D-amino acid oxidase-like deaminating enzyme